MAVHFLKKYCKFVPLQNITISNFMFNLTEIFFSYLFAALTGIFLCTFVGFAFFYLFKKTNNGHHLGVGNLFFSMLTGLVILVGGYAVIKTNGISIFTLLFLIGGGVLYQLKNTKEQITTNSVQANSVQATQGSIAYSIGGSLLSFVLIYSFYFLLIFNFKNQTLGLLHTDDYYYANVLQSMVDNKIENTSYALNYFSTSTNATYYHFFELWFAGIFYDFFQLNPLLSLRLIVLPTYLFVFFTGILTFIEVVWQEGRTKYYFLLLGLLGIGICDFLPLIPNIPFIQNFHEISFFGYSPLKNASIVIFVLPFIINCYKKDYTQAILWLLVIPIASFSAFPAVMGGALIIIYGYGLVFMLFKNLREKLLPYQNNIVKLAILTHLLLLGFCLFYWFTIPPSEAMQTDVFKITEAITFFIVACINSLKYRVLAYAPFIMLLGWLGYKKLIDYKPFLLPILLVLPFMFAGLFSASIIYHDVNALQLSDMPMVAFLRCLFLCLVLYTIYQLSKTQKANASIYILCFVGLMCNNLLGFFVHNYIQKNDKIDTVFFNRINNYTEKERFLAIIQPRTAEDDKNHWSLAWHTRAGNPLDGSQTKLLVNLTDIFTPMEKYGQNIPNDLFPNFRIYSLYYTLQKQNPLFEFMKQQRKKNTFSSIEKSQVDFLKLHQIKYVLVPYSYVITSDMKSYLLGEEVDNYKNYKLLKLDFGK